ncbi:LPXTG-anchored repetitive surface protein SasC [Staphylococcus aureus]|uniref:LPXTG-motif cell wall anchor domain-containing protein n=1 Tax=Staphylococcus aureus TaxID=1280 RepID=A0AB74Q428_STAAU|nr:LPXTG-anchored aggregation protein SasC [Staphylococcus aureus]EGG69493.1 Gram-positive signal peptide protein, YSIRK family [Staphylococcus aureus subsp. aureus 21193]EJX1703393.1 LPXTG-anchored repetitive surface protein SasC [Staphylococcus aureus]EJX2055374.1 LPXTG-anchored repetitive surface protein SasC [Staphylococcus aureus]EJX3509448.1 LPXTG-anchored repetitive surface protein SasC [Staphylococcus aureus]EJX3512020.1 LPXTG-anchored repetitive surface protein SasC [Staphylococcus au
MNLLKKNKYSIRKYKIGIFSTLIGTVLLLSNPNGAQALTTDNNVQSDTNQATPVNSQDKDVANNRGLANSAQNTPNQSATTNQATNQALVNHNNGSIVNQATPTSVQSSTPSAQNNNHTDGNTTATETVSNANNNDVASNNTTLNVPNKTNENGSGGHLTLKEIQEDVRHSSDKPELVAIAEPASNRPKKRSRRAAPADPNATPADPGAAAAGNGGAPVAITAPYTPTTDPNANNAGQNAPNEVLSFDDNSIRPSTNRSVPSVTVVDNLPGFTLINGGKVGVLSHAMVRTSMFEAGSNRTYQAQGNVLALGRISGTDASNHGDFNGIEKSLTVNPNSELIFEFNTMPTKNGQGATNVIIKNADTNDTIAEKTVEGGPTLRLFKVPDNVRNLKIQFVPKNDAITDARGIYQLKDGYKYYSFVDSIGLHSGSHVYVERRTMEPTATNNKEFTVTTSLKNNGNSGASLDTDEFVYKIQLPEGVEYVNNSLTKDFPSNNSGVDVNDMNVTYDAANRVITIKSTGGGTTNSPARLMPDKILDLKYKLRVNNVPTPRTVTFNDTLTYKTYTQDFINSAAESHTVSTNPYTIDIIMNKDALQAEVDRRIQQADYTFASLDIFNDLKKRAQTILAENRNNVPLNKRVSQADIDSLTNQMQHTLIRSVDAENAVNQKADQMEDLVNQNDELTDEEKQAAIQVIEEHKGNIIGDIGDQTTDDGVTRIKDQGIQTLSGDTATPVVKPNAKKAIRDKATKQREIINATPDATEDEIQDALNQLATDETDAIDNVTNATTNADVETAKNNGINTIGAVVPQVTHKKAARDAINQATATKRQQINSNREATQEEKNAALNELTQATNHALEQINQATTNADVDNAKGDGLNAINPIAPVTVVKQAARDAVSHDAQQHIAEINANPDATQEERQAAIDKVNAAVTAANTNILNANTNADVEQVKTNAIQGIQAITPATKVKTDAKNAIDKSAETQHNTIFNNNDATLEEQQAAQQLLDQAVATAKQNINAADTNQEVAQAKDQGTQNIVVIQPATQVKTDARNVVNDKAREAITNINATPGATREEKQEAINRVNTLKNRALTDIGVTSTTAMVNSIRDDAVNQIGAVQPHVTKKQTATGVLNDLATAKKQEINQNTNATTEEKQVALNQVDQELATAINNINQADTNEEVDQAQQLGTKAINAIQPNIVKKPAALAQINQHYNAKLAEINATPDATNDEKNAAINTLNQDRQQAIESIKKANTNAEVDQAATVAENNIDAVQVDVVKKQAARDKITAEVAKRIEAVKQTPNATDEEKQAAVNQINQLKDQAFNQINQNQTNDQVDATTNQAVNAIDNVEAEVVIKPKAIADIEKAVKEKQQQIDNSLDSTDNEKEVASQALAKEKEKALAAIDQAQTNSQVNQAATNGVSAIKIIQPETKVKPAAREKINQKANELRAKINQDKEATAEERQVALDKINEFVNQAMTDITNNRTNQQVDDTTSQALDSIALVAPEHIVRAAARDAVKQQYEAKKQEIEQAEHATDEEKQVALNQLANNEKLALQNINQAVTNNDVKRVETNGIATLKGVQPHIVIKPEAQQAIKASAENQVESIKDTPHATVDELDEANQLISDTLKQAQQEIENTNQDAAVTDVRNQTIKAIEQIKPKVRRKRAALDSIEENNKNQLDAIRNTLDTTQDERDVAIDTLNKIVNTIKNDIAQNKTNAEVDRTETDGNDNIKVILPKVQVKPAARQSVGVKAEAQNALIDQSDLSTEEERLAAKHLVEQALNQAIDQINHADKTAQVNQDSINAQNIISKIKPATTVKATALQQIQNIATNKINLIKANNEATDEEQNIAIAQVEKELIKAKQQIASAVTNADVAYLLHNEKNEIREIEPVINRKASAREQLTTLFNDKKQAIEANIQATVEERNSILAQLQNIYDTAIGQIDQDRSNAQVDKTASLNLQTIHDLDVHPIKKPDAEKTINDDLARVTALVQNYRKVSDRNKADALKAITALKLQMDEELKTARTNADVDAVLKRFNVALSDIEAVITEKENSLLRIDNIAQQTYAKFKAIATPEQLAKVKVLIDQYVADGNRMIDEDATLNDIKQHTQFIVDEILAIKLPAEATKVSPKVIQPAPKVCTPIKKEETHESRKVEKELPNTGSEGMDLPLKEFALITGAALLARRRTKNEKES